MFASAFFDEMEKIAYGVGGPVSGVLARSAAAAGGVRPAEMTTARNNWAQTLRAARPQAGEQPNRLIRQVRDLKAHPRTPRWADVSNYAAK